MTIIRYLVVPFKPHAGPATGRSDFRVAGCTLNQSLLLCLAGALLCGACIKPFTGPWDMRELGQAPAFEWADKTGPVKSLYYANEPYQGRTTRVFAYYAAPSEAEGKVPGMVLVHGGGGKAFAEWAELWAKRGYAAIAMDLAGCGPDDQRLPNGGPNQGHEQKFADFAKGVKEAWSYHAVAAVARAHSLLRSMPEVDPDRTGIT
ncbi:MAG TPA: acetylxylan esterase, partial [Phycisphaerae bacterium]|nr:acetylxylan esterase [Phycisphaerae bacterium]